MVLVEPDIGERVLVRAVLAFRLGREVVGHDPVVARRPPELELFVELVQRDDGVGHEIEEVAVDDAVVGNRSVSRVRAITCSRNI